jgi:hypothetical protein
VTASQFVLSQETINYASLRGQVTDPTDFLMNECVRVEIVTEVFNALNRVNGVTLNSTFGPGIFPVNSLPAFKQTTAVGDPSAFHFAMRLTFWRYASMSSARSEIRPHRFSKCDIKIYEYCSKRDKTVFSSSLQCRQF